MPIEIEGPDGRRHSYPDGTPDTAIKADMQVIYKSWKSPPPQRAGDQTALTGPVASPRMQTVQPYQTDEDWDQIMLATALGEKNRGIIQAIQSTPGRAQRMKEAEAVGTAQGKYQELQRHGAANLRLLDQIRATFNEAHPDIQVSAIGPQNTTKMPAKQPLMIPGINIAVPFMEQPTTVDPRTGIPYNEEMTPVRRNAIVNPKDEKAKKAWDLQNRLEHDIEGLTTKFIMTAGAGANMSDARQKAFTDTIGAMIKATNPEEFHNIANDAENILRETFGLSMPQASSIPGIHPAAVQELLKDTSARRRAQFDELFGEGAAAQIIQQHTAKQGRARN